MRAAQPQGGAARTLSGPMSEHLDLADWRRRVAAAYETLRNDPRAEPARLLGFRAAKDRLFASHPSSPVPLAGRRDFRGLAYWRHAPDLAFRAQLEPDPETLALDVPRSAAGAAIAPIVLDLGKKKKKLIKALKRGEGKLMEDVAQAVEEVRSNLGGHAVGKDLIPVVIVYERKRRSRGGLLPFSM